MLAVASVLGGASEHVALLLALRAVEGFGFLLVVLPAPGLVRRLVPPERISLMLGVWGAYMPLATASALLVGPLWIGAFDWRSWWWLLAAVSAAAAWWLSRAVPDSQAAARRLRHRQPRTIPTALGRTVAPHAVVARRRGSSPPALPSTRASGWR